MSTVQNPQQLNESVANKDEVGGSDSSVPQIISNELLPATPMADSPEKVDELTSLEREIAELHHVHVVEPSSPALAKRVSDADSNGASRDDYDYRENVLLEMQPPNRSNKPAHEFSDPNNDNRSDIADALVSNEQLEHEDLIAVLKGIDSSELDHISQTTERAASITDSELAEGVTIEGEGQFQIMEVVDDDLEEGAMQATLVKEKPLPAAVAPVQDSNIVKLLTSEEIRAVAMEQIAGLNARVERNRSRRKQDIKPLQVESTDLVTSLGADWSDDEVPGVEQDVASGESLKDTKKQQSPVENSTSKATDTITLTQEQKSNTPSAKPVKMTKAVTKADPSIVDMSGTISTAAEPSAPSPTPPQITGFKRTRIIKRKIIWDPDAPETQFSFAQLVRNSGKSKETSATTQTSLLIKKDPQIADIITPATSANSLLIKREPALKKARPATPKEKRAVGDATEKKSAAAAAPTKVLAAKSSTLASRETMSPPKRRSQTPVANGAGGKKKKITEIDRLMGDEGAINMLNALESERGKINEPESDDGKPHKPLMRSRAATISERVIKREVTPTATTSTAAKKEAAPTAIANTTASTKSKRNTKQKPSATWDYVYKQQASEDSMIIRRRSNSSYSSNASQHRLSVDAPTPSTATKSTNSKSKASSNSGVATKSDVKTSTKASNTSTDTRDLSSSDTSLQSGSSLKHIPTNTISKAAFEFAKPQSKSNQTKNRRTKSPMPTRDNDALTSDMKKSAGSGAPSKRGARSPATVEEKERAGAVKSSPIVRGGTETKSNETSGASVSGSTSDVVVKRWAKVAQILFNTHKAKINYTFTVQMMNKLVDILDKLGKDPDCNVVVISTVAPNFCQGIDFTDLTLGSAEKRKHVAVQMANAVKNYLKTLATFPKPLIAGVSGNNIGLGVTQLPLFDIVIASEKGTYETPYARFGQVPEGYCIWNNITKIRGSFKTKLFWMCEKLHSTESALSGLVSKLTAPNKVNDDALAIAKKIAGMSSESFRLMKKTTIHNHLDAIITALDSEFDEIIEQWTSSECQENFKKYLEYGHF